MDVVALFLFVSMSPYTALGFCRSKVGLVIQVDRASMDKDVVVVEDSGV